jgi:hypothetical protein
MNLFQIGLLFSLPVHTYLLTCEKVIDRFLFMKYEIRNTLLKKAQSLNIKVDKDYEIVHERMT